MPASGTDPLADPAPGPSSARAAAPPGRPSGAQGYRAGASPSPGPKAGIRRGGPRVPRARGWRWRGGGGGEGGERPGGWRGPGMTAAPAPQRLTCAAQRRRPQQQQQQQRWGQQRGARARRAARFPAGVDVHAGGARVGARGDARGRGARPGRERTRRGPRALGSHGEQPPAFSLWRWPSRRGRLARSPTRGGSTLARGAAGTPLGSPPSPPRPLRLLLAASSPPPPRDPLPVRAPLERGPAPAAGTESADLALGAVLFSPLVLPPSPLEGTRRGCRSPAPAANQSPAPRSAGPAPASHWAPRARGRGRRASRGEEGAGPGRARARGGGGGRPSASARGRAPRRSPGPPALPAQVPAPGPPGEPAWRGPGFAHSGLGKKKNKKLPLSPTFSFTWTSSELLFWVETELPIQPDRGAQD